MVKYWIMGRVDAPATGGVLPLFYPTLSGKKTCLEDADVPWYCIAGGEGTLSTRPIIASVRIKRGSAIIGGVQIKSHSSNKRKAASLRKTGDRRDLDGVITRPPRFFSELYVSTDSKMFFDAVSSTRKQFRICSPLACECIVLSSPTTKPPLRYFTS